MAGATAVAVGTANFINPSATLEVIEGIENYMKKYRVEDINDLIGCVNRN
jgi:dihydroorotate dehydrogenase (NAD+) catalytic subunit